MSKNNQGFSLHVTKDAKNTTFEGCDIQGAKIEGRGTRMTNSRILSDFSEKHPKVFRSIIGSIIVGLVLLSVEYGLLVK